MHVYESSEGLLYGLYLYPFSPITLALIQSYLDIFPSEALLKDRAELHP